MRISGKYFEIATNEMLISNRKVRKKQTKKEGIIKTKAGQIFAQFKAKALTDITGFGFVFLFVFLFVLIDSKSKTYWTYERDVSERFRF